MLDFGVSKHVQRMIQEVLEPHTTVSKSDHFVVFVSILCPHGPYTMLWAFDIFQ